MSKKTNPAEDHGPDKSPAHQTDEAKGSLKHEQVTDDTMRQKDLPRGSEKVTGDQS
ncbi:hypothetical protein [Novosphingobium malaysiense]|uniref:hypothetical protein n=1 Tax=Novosphingobium malaysiense TaxID=1348853 RepID=UPI000B21DBA7|nr:hypothetical protein [Novosphingobium malaysiense]